MKDEFKEEIRKIARSAKEGKETLRQKSLLSAGDREYIRVIEDFFSAAEEAVDIYNESLERPGLALHRLPPDFLDLFLDIPGRRGGFSIVSPHRIIILFDEDPDLLTVIGKKRSGDGKPGSKLTAAIQLIKVNFKTDNDGITYRDNTGGVVSPHGLMPLFIRWLSSV